MLNSDHAVYQTAIDALAAARPREIEFAKVELNLTCRFNGQRVLVRLLDEGTSSTCTAGRYQVALIRHGQRALYGPHCDTIDAAFSLAPWDQVATL